MEVSASWLAASLWHIAIMMALAVASTGRVVDPNISFRDGTLASP
jgi:hypothetical protein